MTTITRVSDAQVARVRCGKGHGGNTTLVPVQSNTMAECQGCGTFYTVEEIINARPGVPGEGGVILR